MYFSKKGRTLHLGVLCLLVLAAVALCCLAVHS